MMTAAPELNSLAVKVHVANEKWWVDLETGEPLDRNKGEMLMLMVSEVSEAMEGERKGLDDDHLPWRPAPEVEMADLVIRALDFAGGFGYRLRRVQCPAPVANRGAALLEIVRHILIVSYSERLEAPHIVGEALSTVICFAERYCEAFGYDLWGAVDEKMDYNAQRADHKAEARRATGGKKW